MPEGASSVTWSFVDQMNELIFKDGPQRMAEREGELQLKYVGSPDQEEVVDGDPSTPKRVYRPSSLSDLTVATARLRACD